MNVSEFAARKRLKVQREDSSVVINGKSGQLYEYSDTELGVDVHHTSHEGTAHPHVAKDVLGLRRGRHDVAADRGCRRVPQF